jgi:hypothetical protein
LWFPRSERISLSSVAVLGSRLSLAFRTYCSIIPLCFPHGSDSSSSPGRTAKRKNREYGSTGKYKNENTNTGTWGEQHKGKTERTGQQGNKTNKNRSTGRTAKRKNREDRSMGKMDNGNWNMERTTQRKNRQIGKTGDGRLTIEICM